MLTQEMMARMQQATQEGKASEELYNKLLKESNLKSDPVPDAKRLGAAVYGGATFLHFASDLNEGRAAFATSDSVQTVLRFYGAKAKRPAMTADQFAQAYSTKAEDDPTAQMRMGMEMMKRMMQTMREGKSPEQMQAEIYKSVSGMSTELPTEKYSDQELYGNPMFVVLEETALGGVKKPARIVVVFEDRALKRTGFVLHLPPAVVTPPAAVPTEAPPEAPMPVQPRKRPR